MKLLLFINFSIFICLYGQSISSTNNLFEVTQTQQIKLNERQNRLFNIYKNDETTISLKHIDIKPSLFETSATITLKINNGEYLIVEKDRIETRGLNDFSWFGKVKDKKYEYVIFVVKDNNILGSFYYNNISYVIKSLGDGKHVLIKEDPNKQKYKCGTDESNRSPMYKTEQQELGKTNNIFEPKTQSFLSPNDNASQIDILFLYTPYVDSQWTDINSQLQYCIDWTNQAFINSEIYTSLRLVKTEKVDYTATDSRGTDLGRLERKDDGYMDEIHSIRENYHADLVVLAEDIVGAAGLATVGGGFDSTYSFCLVSEYLSPSTFAHELGHLFGCMHDIIATPWFGRNGAHGYHGSDWRYPHPDRYTPKIQYFSNPNLFYNGEKMGSEEKENCAWRINKAILFVSRLFISDPSGNQPPNIPINISPPNGSAIVVPIRYDGCDTCGIFYEWTWSADDPDGEQLYYKVFYKKNTHPETEIRGWSVGGWYSSPWDSSAGALRERDLFGIHRSWFILASDGQYETKGPIWEFDMVSEPPFINVSSSDIQLGANNSNSSTLAINTNVSWSISNNIPWIDVSLEKGYQSSNINLSIKSANYSANQRTDSLIISTYDISKTIIITQSIISTNLKITTGSLTHSFDTVEEGNNPSDKTYSFAIKNSGGGTLIGTVSTGASWLSVIDSSFSLTNKQTKIFTVTASTTDLPIGNYSETISVTSNGGNEEGEVTCNIVIVIGIDELFNSSTIPDDYYLSNNYPNPFNPSTTISFGLPNQSTVSLLIYDITGKVVEEFLRNELLSAGSYNYYFEAKNLSSGIYLYRLKADEFVETKKLILIK